MSWTIHWPGGHVQRVGPVEGYAWYHVREGEPPVAFVPGAARIQPR